MSVTPELPGPCPRCSGLAFWRDCEDRVRCAQCDPARAAWLVRERIRADPTKRVSALEHAVSFLADLLKSTVPAQALAGRPACLDARTALAQALKAGIAPATLMRASWKLGLCSTKTRKGRLWTSATVAAGRFSRLWYRDRMRFLAAPCPCTYFAVSQLLGLGLRWERSRPTVFADTLPDGFPPPDVIHLSISDFKNRQSPPNLKPEIYPRWTSL
jgi:hypothetical protein